MPRVSQESIRFHLYGRVDFTTPDLFCIQRVGPTTVGKNSLSIFSTPTL
jgi:hypothetical protein